MVASTFQDLKAQLETPEIGAEFATIFSNGYLAVAFGAISKSEVDQLVFDALVKVGVIDADGPIYAIARVLKITPAKARGLLFQHQLRNADDAALDRRVLATLGKAKFSVDDKRLSFGVESPLVRSVIEARLKAAGVFSDISLSGDIVKVPVNQLGDFVRVFLDDEAAANLQKKLKKVTKDRDLVKALNDFGGNLAQDVVKDGAKDLAKDGIKRLFEWIASDGVGELSGEVTQWFDQA